MKIRQDQLTATLQKGLAPCYLVSGDEPLLVMEACDQIRMAARQAGIEDRELFHTEAGFDWNHLREEANAMSLFASRRILEVRIPNGKPSDKGNALQDLVKQPNPDNLLLIICPRIDAATQRTAWFKAVDKAGVFLPVWPIERNQYPGWLKRRLQVAGLQAEPAAIAALAHQTEGNLLAAVQEVEKLRLLGASTITEEMINDAIGDSSRFDAFSLADACLLGKQAEASRILSHLRGEGVEPIMILGALTRKVRQLISLKNTSGQQLSEAFKKNNIWPKQQPPYKKALQQLSISDLHSALQKATDIDNAVKGSGEDPWLLLSELTLLLTNVKLPTS
ncbi:DNA polymerase III subunit delta [Bacterioplanoides sp. SCSIO 12839]|uniref:DNA polymerase III subunit delta n=1 Tax=Bacterioplanoides sp. SCSIO 12839 TaxID=2829569 RepID=UPI0021032812|nr:DNA polymerase III subunit delta [Bacterioplanoides sp. SCSIO 12839]UTW48981.1 DNA polymerase III subunit delta [Bacterioplanoides sp. SCSIO 12839]